ncbi:hypothetical protein [Peribacillus sp. V2I11]|uniref:hypothetical protein n=1 Tax=Peribacillus sp. V2I11 TaxID=3042277 RepID=UPI0027818464|nr:hypothetical protein [Peribacillus sp. V2I11]MDQ0882095.1 hypothetical protein [Peribacillus sp. V2I11]
MKKVCMKFIFPFCLTIFLVGCSIEKEDMKEDMKEDPGLDRSQKIEVSSEEIQNWF